VDADAARELGVASGHAPGKATGWRFLGAGEGSSEHDGVSASSECFADVAAVAHAAVGDDWDVASGVAEVLIARRRAFNGGGDLGYAYAENFTGCADSAGPDTHEHTGDPGLHQFLGRLVSNGVTNDNGDADVLDKLFKDQTSRRGGDVTSARDGGLNDKDISAGVYSNRGQFLGVGRGTGDGTNATFRLDFPDALTDKFFLERRFRQALNDGCRIILRSGYDFGDGSSSIIVATLEALKVHNCEAAAVSELDRERGIDDGIESSGDDGEGKCVLRYAEMDIGKFGVDGDCAGDDRYFVKAVGGSEFFVW
jgi:hypothetical protein